MNNQDSDLDKLANLLRFLCAPADMQVMAIDKYNNEYASGEARAHIWNPFVEIVEGVYKLPAFSIPESLPSEAYLAWEELKCLISLILEQPDGCNVSSSNIINDPEWRLVRIAAERCLIQLNQHKVSTSNVFELLCWFGD